MEIGTEQVFIVNSTELNQDSPGSPLERVFGMPEAEAGPEVLETTSESVLAQDGMLSRSTMCRLCATVTEMVVPIFEGEGLQHDLANKIHQHLPIQVSQDDMLPVVMCFQCTSTLLAWHELVVCSVQADSVMRNHLNYRNSASEQQQQQPNIQASQNEDNKSEDIIKIIKSVLMEYLHSLNMEDNSQVELVCQRCTTKPALTAEDFSQHLITEHRSEVSNEAAIQTFIRDHITFEEALIFDTEDVESDDTEALETPKQKPLPTLLCPYCESAFSSTSRLIYHLNTHMEISIEDGVECCNVLYSTRKEFAAHLQEKHVNRLIYDPETLCKSCGFAADSPGLLRAHVQERHKEEGREKKPKKESAKNQKSIPAVCPECNKTFSHKYNMFFHMKSHRTSERYRCDKCGKEYSTKGNLTQHARLAHEGELTHACGACGELFATRAARAVHARVHSGARPYRCELCRGSFRARDSLAAHMDAHHDRRPHRCALCGRAFRKRSHLAAHTRVHARAPISKTPFVAGPARGAARPTRDPDTK